MTKPRTVLTAVAVACAVSACGSRSPYWDTSVAAGAGSFGLANGVALVDNVDHRVVLVTALANQQLSTHAFPVGHNVISQATTPSPDGARLFVLSAGDTPRRTAKDQYPSLTVVDASSFTAQSKMYTTTVALPNLAIDPLGDWAVAYTGPGAPASFVQNANEIVIFDLTKPPSITNPISHTIRSQGGTPQRLTFTPGMNLPKVTGSGRLLIVETDIDVTLLELDHPSSDVTVSLTSGTNAQQVMPAGAVVDSGFDPTNPAAMPGPPRIALRAVNNRNVFTFTLGASDTNDFTPIINVVDVGGTPSDIAFVRADQDVLRVAALVPSLTSAVLVDADTSITTQVALPAPYSRLSLVTNVVGSATGTDVAMLWSGSASGVALWALGNTVGQPYHSIEVLPITQQVQTVDEVTKQAQLKVLETADASNASGFLVLDLLKRTASPLQTMGKATLAIAPDGLRMWAFAQGGTDLAKLDFGGPDALNPVPLTTDKTIDAVYDVARPPAPGGGDGGRSLIAIHNQGTVGATVFNALNPDTATARIVPALLLEGP
jgi:hypothetical protein